MTKALIVNSCDECAYHEQLWTGEYAKPERIYFCANSKTQFLIPNEGKHKIHPDCDLDDLDVIIGGYA
jgi:hypothetical protein|tara:strand:- start:354 stop:557 length:204 start_codon:yes stop_codon:yes gene_type:complete